jgi:hypothetical protein
MGEFPPVSFLHLYRADPVVSLTFYYFTYPQPSTRFPLLFFIACSPIHQFLHIRFEEEAGRINGTIARKGAIDSISGPVAIA